METRVVNFSDCTPEEKLDLMRSIIWSRDASEYAWSLVPKSGLSPIFVTVEKLEKRDFKQVIHGKSYNVKTSFLIAVNLGNPFSHPPLYMEMLHQTRSGRLFLLLISPEGDPTSLCKALILPVTPEEAMSWGESLVDGARERVENTVRAALANPPPPDDREPMSSTVLRLPPALMKQVTDAAKEQWMSRGEWIMRSLERTLKDS